MAFIPCSFFQKDHLKRAFVMLIFFIQKALNQTMCFIVSLRYQKVRLPPLMMSQEDFVQLVFYQKVSRLLMALHQILLILSVAYLTEVFLDFMFLPQKENFQEPMLPILKDLVAGFGKESKYLSFIQTKTVFSPLALAFIPLFVLMVFSIVELALMFFPHQMSC